MGPGDKERRSGKPGPIPGGVERRRPESERHGPRRDDLAGGGRTAVSADAALRARDLDRPTAEDLERAEAELTIVRRNWTPPPG